MQIDLRSEGQNGILVGTRRGVVEQALLAHDPGSQGKPKSEMWWVKAETGTTVWVCYLQFRISLIFRY
jgi:hypothetical protein